MTERAKLAQDFHDQGYNCAQAVACAYCDLVGDEIVAFTIGEAVNDDTFVVHIEKAYADIEGAYTMINQQFVEHEIVGKYKYTNREDDVGEEGLRKAKLSYKPVFMIEKGVVTLKEDSEKECAKDDI